MGDYVSKRRVRLEVRGWRLEAKEALGRRLEVGGERDIGNFRFEVQGTRFEEKQSGTFRLLHFTLGLAPCALSLFYISP
jgi:hypothetical protein